ncbi:MAG: hypothetical protein QMD09_07910 [Desulfatibacillaceae bacterium]|nr:hypothetical protein [Desulfatibacillaceae bacterium]
MNSKNAKNRLLKQNLAKAQQRLFNKLTALDIASLEISQSSKKYLKSKVGEAKNMLGLYGRLLYLAMKQSDIPPENFVLVDYGGGNGLISFLALELGVGRVIYNDIFDVSCKDAAIVAKALALNLASIVNGDADKLIGYLNSNSIKIDAVVSYDVIEHIYDVKSHFEQLYSINSQGFAVIYASGANKANPRYVRHIKRAQKEVEYFDRQTSPDHKERDCLQSYLSARRDIIKAHAPTLAPEQVEELALATRGLIKSDIEKCVDEFVACGRISHKPNHPTNTCDPFTGNWCEHLMDLGWLEGVVRQSGFDVKISPGFYGLAGSRAKGAAKLLLNGFIRLAGKRAMFAAPHFVVQAKKRP